MDASAPSLPCIVRLGGAVRGDLEAGLRREWLVTNGLGGYAMGSLAGPPTRRYHGHLVAALTPPVGRTVLVGGLLEWVVVGGERLALHALERTDGTFDGRGWERLAGFQLEGSIPTWTFDLGPGRLVKRLWMAHGSNTTYLRYELIGWDGPVELEIAPLTTARDHHQLWRGRRRSPRIDRRDGDERWPVAVRIAHRDAAAVTTLLADRGRFEVRGRWIHGLRHRAETSRGEDDVADLHASGRLRTVIDPRRPLTIVLTVDADLAAVVAGDVALRAEQERQAGLLARAGISAAATDVATVGPLLPVLVLAADAFLVERRIPGRTHDEPELEGRSVIAGYPWFNDWGRDTMIALPGLTLATGRIDEAASILRGFARFVRDGLVPNDFPDRTGDPVDYHTADASLWYVQAIEAYRVATGDEALVDELLPTVRSIVEHHLRGTRFGIGVDPADGLVRASAEGYQLTWMDAKVSGWVVTPRRGKPVEVQALWVNALRIAASWVTDRGDATEAAGLTADADRATVSFAQRFWRDDLGYLLDVVDGPDGDDASLRPNQLLAISLPHPLVTGERARSMLDTCRAFLVTPLGLRSLSPSDPAYRGQHRGERRVRDAAYHQGTVWTWLTGPYLDATLAVTGDVAGVRAALEPFRAHLSDAGLGSVSEVLDGDSPHRPSGCIAQAWGVAEVLRILRRVEAYETRSSAPRLDARAGP